MPDWGNTNQDTFLNMGRKPTLVHLKDSDVVAFWADMIPRKATDMTLYDEPSGTSYYTHGSALDRGTRLLCWVRMSNGEVESKARWVPFYYSRNPADSSAIFPIREVFEPTVSYDPNSNQLSLWFWTNYQWNHDSNDYNENSVFPIGDDPSAWAEMPGYRVTGGTAKRVLCYAAGYFTRLYATGGVIGGWDYSATLSDNSYEMVPIFQRPRIVQIDVDATNKSTGLIVDGPGSGTFSFIIRIKGWYPGVPSYLAAKMYLADVYGDGAYPRFNATETNVPVKVVQVADEEVVPFGAQLIATRIFEDPFVDTNGNPILDGSGKEQQKQVYWVDPARWY